MKPKSKMFLNRDSLFLEGASDIEIMRSFFYALRNYCTHNRKVRHSKTEHLQWFNRIKKYRKYMAKGRWK